VIRAAALEDAPLLLGLMREFYAFEHLTFDETRARAALVRLLDDASLGQVFLVEEDGGIAGYVVVAFGYSLEFHGRDAFVDELFLQPAVRGRGLGREVLRFVEEHCRRSGVTALHLEVERKNKAAQEFYRRLGFQDHDRYLMTQWLS
jgi:diamine N-acetyltransferase